MNSLYSCSFTETRFFPRNFAQGLTGPQLPYCIKQIIGQFTHPVMAVRKDFLVRFAAFGQAKIPTDKRGFDGKGLASAPITRFSIRRVSGDAMGARKPVARLSAPSQD